MWEPRGLRLGWIDAGQFVCARSRCLSLQGGSSLLGPSNSCNAHLGSPDRIRPIQTWSNIIINAGGNIGVTSLFLSVRSAMERAIVYDGYEDKEAISHWQSILCVQASVHCADKHLETEWLTRANGCSLCNMWRGWCNPGRVEWAGPSFWRSTKEAGRQSRNWLSEKVPAGGPAVWCSRARQPEQQVQASWWSAHRCSFLNWWWCAGALSYSGVCIQCLDKRARQYGGICASNALGRIYGEYLSLLLTLHDVL